MTHILVGLDGSAFARAALPVAIGLARTLGASIELVTVHEPEPGRHELSGSSTQDQALDRDQLAQLHHAAVEALESARRYIVSLPDAPTVSTTVLTGVPAERLLDHARARDAQLLVVTTHGLGGVSRQWMGSVTDALVRQATLPIVTVRPPERDDADTGAATEPATEWALNTILVTLDGTGASEQVLDCLQGLVGDRAQYLLMRAATPLHPLLRAIATAREYDRDLTEQRVIADSYLDGVVSRLEQTGLRATRYTAVDFAPARAIVECAVEQAVDMIAIATHGRGPIGRFMLGSVADKVVRTASRPVLLVRVPTEAS
jgi:nucleotide-binding universal stress UspA family protein